MYFNFVFMVENIQIINMNILIKISCLRQKKKKIMSFDSIIVFFNEFNLCTLLV
jgi:hypothetical protein